MANWPNASGTTATKNNGNAIAFPAATADWGTVVAFGIYDAASSGNLLYTGPVNSPTGKPVNNGDTLTFPATTGLVITED